MKEDLCLRAGVVKDQRDPVTAHLIQNRRNRVDPAAASPWGKFLGLQHGDVGIGAGIGVKDVARVGVTGQQMRDGRRILDRRGKPDAAHVGAKLLQTRQRQPQLIAALAVRQRMDFVDDDTFETGKGARGILVGTKQREALRRRQQDMRRVGTLPTLARGRRVPGAVLHPDRQVHIGNRGGEVAPDVRRQRLERRNIERVEPLMPALGEIHQRRQKTGQRLAPAGRRDQQKRGVIGARQHLGLVRMHLPATGSEPVEEFVRQEFVRRGRGEHNVNIVAMGPLGEAISSLSPTRPAAPRFRPKTALAR